MRKFRFALMFLLFAASLACALPSLTRQDTLQGVTVAVTPAPLHEESVTWDFAVVFHSLGRPLQDDMLQGAFLVADGQRLQPLSWEGQGPTLARHRAGILRFPAVRSIPEELEFHLQRPGEASARTFRWDFRGWLALASERGH